MLLKAWRTISTVLAVVMTLLQFSCGSLERQGKWDKTFDWRALTAGDLKGLQSRRPTNVETEVPLQMSGLGSTPGSSTTKPPEI